MSDYQGAEQIVVLRPKQSIEIFGSPGDACVGVFGVQCVEATGAQATIYVDANRKEQLGNKVTLDHANEVTLCGSRLILANPSDKDASVRVRTREVFLNK